MITQVAFDPNDDNSIYVATWVNGVWRYDYSEGGSISNGSQVIAPEVNLNRDSTHENGSYGIAFHDDPTLGSVMYLSRAMQNGTNASPITQGLGSVVRINDANGDAVGESWKDPSNLNASVQTAQAAGYFQNSKRTRFSAKCFRIAGGKYLSHRNNFHSGVRQSV